MENQHSKNVKEFDFLLDEQAHYLFGKLDFKLKDGEHIQYFGGDTKYFNYIRLYKSTLDNYYRKYFGVALEEGGESSQKYYYLDYNSAEVVSFSARHKYPFKNSHLIIGLILYKTIFFEGNVELSSKKEFKKIVRNESDQYQLGLLKLIANSSGNRKIKFDDDKIDDAIDSAFKQFQKIKWIELLDSDTFETRASIHRIRSLFEEQILDIDNIITRY